VFHHVLASNKKEQRMKFIIEEDELVTTTRYFAIEAEDLDKAINIAKSGEVRPYDTETHSPMDVSYQDSHPATGDEIKRLFP
jgi:hypothetical protein